MDKQEEKKPEMLEITVKVDLHAIETILPEVKDLKEGGKALLENLIQRYLNIDYFNDDDIGVITESINENIKENITEEITTLVFICPSCKKERRLESCEDGGFISSPITELDEDGDFEYGEITVHESFVCRFQCEVCGYVIKDEKGENITDNLEVIEWLKKSCKESK